MEKITSMTLEGIKSIVDLYKSYHNCNYVEVSNIAKELKVNKLELWDFIQNNKYHFELICLRETNSTFIKYRYIKDVYLNPMTEEEYLDMIENSDLVNHV